MVVACFKVPLQYLHVHGGTEVNMKVSGPRLKSGTVQIRNMSGNLYTATVGFNWCLLRRAENLWVLLCQNTECNSREN
jgi:hypothetical protein